MFGLFFITDGGDDTGIEKFAKFFTDGAAVKENDLGATCDESEKALKYVVVLLLVNNYNKTIMEGFRGLLTCHRIPTTRLILKATHCQSSSHRVIKGKVGL